MNFFLKKIPEAKQLEATYLRVLAIMDVSSPGSRCGVSGGSVSSLSFK